MSGVVSKATPLIHLAKAKYAVFSTQFLKALEQLNSCLH